MRDIFVYIVYKVSR